MSAASSSPSIAVSLVRPALRLQGLAEWPPSSTHGEDAAAAAADVTEDQVEGMVTAARFLGNNNKKKRRRRLRNTRKRQQQETRKNKGEYDPWRDIFQKGGFRPEEDLVAERRTSNDDDFYYFDGIPVGAEYLYYEYGPYEDEEEEVSRGDRKAEGGGGGGKKRIPYDFEGPVDLTEKIDGGGRDPFSISKQEASNHHHQQQGRPHQLLSPQQPSLTRRVADAVFSPFALGVATVVGIPLLLAAAYWLFVVNGPTPVVKARDGGEEDREEDVLLGVLEAVAERVREAVEMMAMMVD